MTRVTTGCWWWWWSCGGRGDLGSCCGCFGCCCCQCCGSGCCSCCLRAQCSRGCLRWVSAGNITKTYIRLVSRSTDTAWTGHGVVTREQKVALPVEPGEEGAVIPA